MWYKVLNKLLNYKAIKHTQPKLHLKQQEKLTGDGDIIKKQKAKHQTK